MTVDPVEIFAAWFAAMSDREIDDYAASGEPMDKAGAYAIQRLASKFLKESRAATSTWWACRWRWSTATCGSYSWRSAAKGSTLAARWAGIPQAAFATQLIGPRGV